MAGKISLRAKVLIGIAIGCGVWIAMTPDASQTIEPVRSQGTSTGPRAHPASPSRRSPVLNAAFSVPNRIVKDSSPASLFSAQSWYVAPPAAPLAPVVARAPAAPTAPALPFAFMGSYRPDGAAPIYFLTAGDRVYDVKVGDTLDNTYSVDGVKSGQMLLTYMPLKIQQSLAVGDEQ